MYFYQKISSVDVSPTARTVYRALLHYANRTTWSCFPSIQTLVKDTGLSRTTIIRCLNILEKNGCILKIHRTRQENNGQTSNMYFFN